MTRKVSTAAASLAAKRQAALDARCSNVTPSPELARAVRQARREIRGWRRVLGVEAWISGANPVGDDTGEASRRKFGSHTRRRP